MTASKAGSGPRPTLAIYWASACGGREIDIANLGERVLDLAERLDLVFCVAVAAAEGRLDHRAEVAGHDGYFQAIQESLNETLHIMTAPVPGRAAHPGVGPPGRERPGRGAGELIDGFRVEARPEALVRRSEREEWSPESLSHLHVAEF